MIYLRDLIEPLRILDKRDGHYLQSTTSSRWPGMIRLIENESYARDAFKTFIVLYSGFSIMLNRIFNRKKAESKLSLLRHHSHFPPTCSLINIYVHSPKQHIMDLHVSSSQFYPEEGVQIGGRRLGFPVCFALIRARFPLSCTTSKFFLRAPDPILPMSHTLQDCYRPICMHHSAFTRGCIEPNDENCGCLDGQANYTKSRQWLPLVQT